MGRPPSDGVQLKIRLRPQTLDALTEAAAELGRPVNREIATRLEASVVADKTNGGAGTHEFVRLWSATVGAIELQRQKSWLRDKATWEAVMAVTINMMNGVKPALPQDVESAVEGTRAELSTAYAKAVSAQEALDTDFPLSAMFAGLRLPVGSILASGNDLQDYESALARLAQLKYAWSEAQLALETAEAPIRQEIDRATAEAKAVAADVRKKLEAVGKP